MSRVLVAMSGGVDSSAVCLLLRDAGHEVVGMTMRVYDLPQQFTENNDEPDFIIKARRLAQHLGIEHHVVDVREEFRRTIVQNFLDEYSNGRTPNPCVLCNRDFKFRLLSEMAQQYHCELMATGHYVKKVVHDHKHFLLLGDDLRKDQSYFLWRVPQDTLQRCIFPLGEMEKTEVRKYLDAKGFEVHAKQSESMEICFVEADYRDFLRQQRPELAETVRGGNFVDNSGRKLGEHLGVPFYTVGQRKGLGIALGKPAYVLRLNAAKNTIVLGDEADLLTSVFFIEDPVFVDEAEAFAHEALTVRVRYHSKPVACRMERLPDTHLILVRTQQPVSAITPGQSAVFYIGNRLVGGAIIANQKGIGAYGG
jgi:tRNA-specific 2-thiouridylase